MSSLVRLSRGLTEYSGSTRSVGLLRLGWALILWARWADELLPYRRMEPEHWVLGVLFFLGTFLMAVGLFSRTATLLSGCVTLYMVFIVGHMGGNEAWTHHHTTFLAVGTVLISLTPCGHSFSLDRWMAIRRAERSGVAWPTEYGNVWAVRLLALQMSTIYFWGAFDKTRWAVLGGDRMEQPFMYLYFGSDYPGDWFHWLAVLTAWCVVLLEYCLSFGLWFRRVRAPLMLVGILFHCVMYYALPVTVFSVACIFAYLAFLEPDTVHRSIDRMLGIKE